MIKVLKNHKGMTLVELLAVIVIIGIIAAIAVPAIGNLLENTRKDQVVANATSMQEAARLYVLSEEAKGNLTTGDIKASDLVTAGYLDIEPKDPKNVAYTTAVVNYSVDQATGAMKFTTTLVSPNYEVGPKDAKEMTRDDVTRP